MSVLVKACYETVKQFNGVSVTTKIGNKKHQVYFKLYCDDSNLDECIKLFKANSNIVMLDYQGSLLGLEGKDLTGVYIIRQYEYGMNVVDKDIQSIVDELPEGVTPIIKLPLEFMDMRFIYEVTSKFPMVRFCGGTYFCLEGCNLGCCGRDILDKCGVKYDKDNYLHEGCSCALETFTEEDVVLEIGKVAQRKSSSGTSKGKYTSKKTLQFKELLAQAEPLF